MARSYGQIMSAIWNDADFRKLSGGAQRAYLMLVTQADISSAGTLPLTVGRWSRYASDTSSDALWHALSELRDNAFIAYDDETEELLVRKFVKWDGGANNTKRRPAITGAANAVASVDLRSILARELDALDVEHSLSAHSADSLFRPSEPPRDTPRVVVTEGELEPDPQPSTLNPHPAASPKPEPHKRGKRIDPDWKPPPTEVEWRRENGISDLVARRELPKFVDYWTAKPGRDAVKLDWLATWRNWLRNAQEREPANRHGPPGERPQDLLAALSKGNRP